MMVKMRNFSTFLGVFFFLLKNNAFFYSNIGNFVVVVAGAVNNLLRVENNLYVIVHSSNIQG